MIVYANNKSMHLPRRKKRVINSNSSRKDATAVIKVEPYRPAAQNIPSLFDRRCSDGVWLEKEELEANDLLDAMIYGERGA